MEYSAHFTNCQREREHECEGWDGEKKKMEEKERERERVHIVDLPALILLENAISHSALGAQANWPNLAGGVMYFGWLPLFFSLAARCGPPR